MQDRENIVESLDAEVSGEEGEVEAIVIEHTVKAEATEVFGEEGEVEASVLDYLPEGWEMGEGGRVVHAAHYNSEAVEANLSADEEGSVVVRRYIPEGWEVGDVRGRLVHSKRYNSRAITPKSEA